MPTIKKLQPFNLDSNASFTFGNVTANFFTGNGSLLTGLPAGYANSNVAGYLPTYTGNVAAGNATITSTLTTANLTVTNKTNLGSNANITITGGTSGYALTTDGAGNLLWSESAGGGLKYTAATTPPASGNISGDQWFNTESSILYEYIDDGTSLYWVDIQTPTVATISSSTYVNRSYTGDGATTTYTVTTGCTVNNILVFLNGICQMPTTDYTVSGTVLTLIPAPTSGTVIQVRELPR